jgi:Lon protease-like protein
MGCPFDPGEKQALLEAVTLAERAETMMAILRMASAGGDGPAARH